MFYPALSREASAAAADVARAWSEAASAWRALATAPWAPEAAEHWIAAARAGQRAQLAGLRAAMLAGSGLRLEATPFGLTGMFAAVAPKDGAAEAPEPAEGAARRGFQALAKPLGRADDLTRIRGLGARMQEKLNRLGVFHFWQIASLAKAEAERLDAELAAGGRVLRDAWVAQAKRLAEDVTA